MTKKRSVMLIALVLALLMPVITVFATVANAEATGTPATTSTKYESPDINALMGAGEEPEDISVSAKTHYQTKMWYEYIQYSDHAVASYRESDDSRLVFYDPYTYTNAMVMDVPSKEEIEFSTMSSYSFSYTTSKTLSSNLSSTYTSSEAIQSSGTDETGSEVKNTGTTKTTFNHKTHSTDRGAVVGENRSTHELFESDTELGQKGGLIGIVASETIKIGIDTTQQHNRTTYEDHGTDTDYEGEDTVEYDTTSNTTGWTRLSDRVTRSTGSSKSTSTTWSETEGTTVTKNFAATHFADDGVTPLPWAVVKYQVKMPVKCCLQIKVEGEWVTVSTVYCMLTTVQGTCRAWLQNGELYYEDWGNGRPVVATDFWSGYLSEDALIAAYANKLYPKGGGN